ncbi:MAG: tetratricopeptide repeat protein [Chthoniobacteraceae bacterium]
MSRKRRKTSPATSSRRAWIFAAVAVLWMAGLVWWKQRPPAPAKIAATPPAPLLEPQEKVFAEYAGAESCRGCHADQFAKWATSDHFHAERKPVPALDDAAFVPPHAFKHGTQESSTAKSGADFLLTTPGFDGEREAYPVARVIGHDPLRQMLIERPRGRVQSSELAFDPHRGEWFDVYGNEDRVPGEWGHWTGRGMTWNTMCASCHNTRLRKNYDAATDSFHTAMAEMTVACEACHGPMKAHGDWHKAHPGEAEPNPRRFTRDQVFDTCGACHARRRELTGDFVPGDHFAEHFQLTTVDESDLYYADGQVRDELYEYGSFHSSKMHAAGVRCVDCHDPHTGKRRFEGNALCIQCHSGAPSQIPSITVVAPVIDPVAHSFHAAGSAGAECTACHMPVTNYMQRHPRHDHGFTIPDPLLTKQHGIPNACNRCHTDKDADWALAAADKWWGVKMQRPARERAQRIAGARSGAARSSAPLLASWQAETSPYWKAAILKLLAPWSGELEVVRALGDGLVHPDPLVRTAAAQQLEPAGQSRTWLERGLTDPSRSVRVAAAWTLRETVALESRAGRELQHALDLGADQPTGQLQLGVFAQGRRDDAGALSHFQRAVSWDPRSGGLRHEYAVLLSQLGRAADALEEMKEAVRLEPQNAEFHYKLALAWNEAGNLANALPEFEKAVELDRRHARAWYNLGLARNSIGQPEQAIAALQQGEAADPRDARLPYARATIHARRGQKEEARAAAQRALEIAPGYGEARALLESLGP